MKKNVLWIVLAAALVAVITAAAVLYNIFGKEYAGANLGQAQEESGSSQAAVAAPDFTAMDGEGNEVRLSDYQGKPVVLNFWATWCGYCKEEMPDFQTAYEKYPDVQFLMVNATDGVQETLDKAKSYVHDQGFTFPVVYDTELDAVNTYGINAFPCTFFIDGDGNLVARGSGMLTMETLEQGIAMITE